MHCVAPLGSPRPGANSAASAPVYSRQQGHSIMNSSDAYTIALHRVEEVCRRDLTYPDAPLDNTVRSGPSRPCSH